MLLIMYVCLWDVYFNFFECILDLIENIGTTPRTEI